MARSSMVTSDGTDRGEHAPPGRMVSDRDHPSRQSEGGSEAHGAVRAEAVCDGGIFQRLDTCAAFPYSVREYARRFLWEFVAAVLVRPSPGRLVGWRRFWLRRFGARIEGTCNIRPSARVRHPWLLRMGDYSTLADRVEVYNLGPIEIGAHTVISQNTHLCNGTHDYRDPSLPLVRPTMRIGSGVWVCADAFIGPGVTIGDNALVGARSVVMRDVPAGVIVAGNPAVVVRERPMLRAGTVAGVGPSGEAGGRR